MECIHVGFRWLVKELKLLLCTISRNNKKRLKSWYNQLDALTDLELLNTILRSIYENDSIDGTKEGPKYVERLAKK